MTIVSSQGLGPLTKEKKCLAVCFYNFKKKDREKEKPTLFCLVVVCCIPLFLF